MIKITFEGANLKSVLLDIREYLAVTAAPAGVTNEAAKEVAATAAEIVQVAEPVVEKPVEKPVEKLVEKPGKTGKGRTAAQIAADKERMAKMRAKRGKTRATSSDEGFAPEEVEEPEIETTTEFAPPGVLFPKIKVPEPKPPVTDPIEIARIRQKTIQDLQEAYANGKQQEVFELLGRFGNGAKSFRELTPEAFLPIREAIDNGGLT